MKVHQALIFTQSKYPGLGCKTMADTGDTDSSLTWIVKSI